MLPNCSVIALGYWDIFTFQCIVHLDVQFAVHFIHQGSKLAIAVDGLHSILSCCKPGIVPASLDWLEVQDL
jgi:hypothetical protein